MRLALILHHIAPASVARIQNKLSFCDSTADLVEDYLIYIDLECSRGARIAPTLLNLDPSSIPGLNEQRAEMTQFVKYGAFLRTLSSHQNMAIIALQGEEISAPHMHAPSTVTAGNDLLFHSAGRSSHVRSSPKMWRRDVQAPDLTAMTLYYGP
ncbi:hypothetical protein Y032_0050g2027 [Ancylostoma ceylanicum]|uniref:Uncharacterized protein n=1 Tax=Ancylostoma ceylanicum TaxID=53326 RepID=A0A016U932_9BILA|nr:hypothetical protein Y032_0050g2027 [Ancylostoma ceylanicum]